MNNKDLLKAIGEIDDKYLIEDNGIKEKNRIRTNNMVRIMKKFKIGYALIPICWVVVISGIIFLNYKNDNNNLFENKLYIAKENNITLNINDLSKTGMTILDTDTKTVSGFNIPYLFKVNENANQNEEFFIIPSDLTQIKNYIVYIKNDKDSNEYNIIANYIMLITNGNERNIKVKYSKDQEPLRDYYFSEEDSKTTTINGIDLKIYKYEKSFYTTFSYNGYNFDIETSNITEQEFSDYLVSILR